MKALAAFMPFLGCIGIQKNWRDNTKVVSTTEGDYESTDNIKTTVGVMYAPIDPLRELHFKTGIERIHATDSYEMMWEIEYEWTPFGEDNE